MNTNPDRQTRFVSYAQNFEDVMLWRALGNICNGHYIDVGAADPIDMSVTNAFYQAGWRGINIEPATHYFNRLETARPADVNLNMALGSAPGRQTFHEIPTTGLSTLDRHIAEKHAQKGWDIQTKPVDVFTLAEICRRYADEIIHFLKIDVEGTESEVLAGADFERFRPWIVLLEATRPLTTIEAIEWEPALLACGYVFVWFDGLNRFYIAKEHHEDLKQHFYLPPNSFDNFDKFNLMLSNGIASRECAINEMTKKSKDQTNEIQLLEAEVLHLRPHIHQNASLHTHIANLSRQVEEIGERNAALTAQNSDRQDRMTAELARLTFANEHLKAENTWLQLKTHALSSAGSQLERLRLELHWDQGPRVLKLLLPIARGLRKLSHVKIIRVFGRPALRYLRGTKPAARNEVDEEIPQADHTLDQDLIIDSEPVEDNSEALVLSDPPDSSIIVPFPRTRARTTVHQFHPGSAYGDAVTNSMLLTRRILRELGYVSDIYVVHRDPVLADEILLIDDLPLHDDYVLIVLHSLGYDDAARIAAYPAPKILMYHNITPAHLLSEIPELARLATLGRSQLAFWRPRISSALAVSGFNALELRRHDYTDVAVCPLLFDIELLRARARQGAPRDTDAPFTILFVGRIIESKGQDALVDAFGIFNLRYGPNCRLVLVGRTEGGGDRYLADLYQRIGEQGLRRAVVLTGLVTDQELFEWYGRADLYVSLSLHEGFGVPLVEAMAQDIPVLAYAAGAVPFTLQEDGAAPGILHSRDPATVAEAMLKIANESAWKAEIIAAQQANLDRFVLARHIPVLEKALAQAGASLFQQNRSLPASNHLSFVIAGHFNGSYSLAAVNRSLASALADAAPGRVRIQPVEGTRTSYLGGVPPVELRLMQTLAAASPRASAPVVVISQHYPVHVPDENDTAADLTISYFFWEESLVPAATVACLNQAFDAIFVPSAFVAKALIDSGVRLPVKIIGYAPQLQAFFRMGEARISRSTPARCTFLHVSSGFPRKGIDILLNAFASVFSSSDPVRLIIKSFPNPHNETERQIQEICAGNGAPEIILIDKDLDQSDLLDLYDQSDVAVLPTRGEGFNIPAAEAMAAALPLIITGAGGNADFITQIDATLLPWQWEFSRSHFSAGQSLWLAPDETALAQALRDRFEQVMAGDRAAKMRAEQTRAAVMKRLNRAGWANRVTQAATDVFLTHRPRGNRITIVSPWDVGCGVAEYTRYLSQSLVRQLSPCERFSIISDDRTMGGIGSQFAVRPGWTIGAADTAARLAVIISQEDPHVLMIQHQPGLMAWSSLAALLRDARISSRVVIVTLHSTMHLTSLPEEEKHEVLRALGCVSRVIVHTVADINFLRALNLSSNVAMVSHGAPAPRKTAPPREISPDDEVLIGSYGFLLPQKGLSLLIEAIPELQKTFPKLRVRFVNALYDAPESTAALMQCQRLATACGVDNSIEWITAFLPHEQSQKHLRETDLLVLPYQPTVESSSAALRSCLATGVPVAVTPLPIFEEAGDAVARFSGSTPADIAADIIILLQQQKTRQALQIASKTWVETRSWDRIACQLHGMMGGLVANQCVPQPPSASLNAANAPKDAFMQAAQWH